MEKVSVSKGLLAAVVAVAAGALLAVAFLLGRVSAPAIPSAPPARLARPAWTPAPPASDSPGVRAPDPPSASTPAALQEPAPKALPPEIGAAVPPSPGPAPGLREAGSARVPSDPDREAVTAYLDAVDRIQPGKMSGDPEGMANEMAGALVRGDTSSLEELIRETEGARSRLAALTPPVACAAHHRESLGSLDDALEMLRSLRSAMGSPEPAAQLAGVASHANALRARAEAVKKEEQALRQRYVTGR